MHIWKGTSLGLTCPQQAADGRPVSEGLHDCNSSFTPAWRARGSFASMVTSFLKWRLETAANLRLLFFERGLHVIQTVHRPPPTINADHLAQLAHASCCMHACGARSKAACWLVLYRKWPQ